MSDQSGKQRRGDTGKQRGADTPFTAQDAMAFMQKIWNPFAMPLSDQDMSNIGAYYESLKK